MIALLASQAFVASWGGIGGGSPTDWGNPNNWTPTGVPGLGVGVDINNNAIPGPILTAGQNFAVDGILNQDLGTTVTIDAGASLSVGNGDYNMGLFPTGPAVTTTLNINGTFTANGQILGGIDPSATIEMNVGPTGTLKAFSNFFIGFNVSHGTLNVASGGQVNAVFLGVGWVGSGTMNVASGGNVVNLGVTNIWCRGLWWRQQYHHFGWYN